MSLSVLAFIILFLNLYMCFFFLFLQIEGAPEIFPRQKKQKWEMNLSTALASSQSSSSLSTLSRSRKVYTVNDHATSSNTSGQTWAWVWMNFKSSLHFKLEILFERMDPYVQDKATICLCNLYEEILILFKRMWCFGKVLPHLLALYSS